MGKLQKLIPYNLKLYFFRKKFSKRFKSKVFPVNIFDIDKVEKIGRGSYGPIKVSCWDNEREGLIIGDFVSFAEGVHFVLGGNHRMDTLMSYPTWMDNPKATLKQSATKGKIVVEDDVWIGTNALILSGVTIGQGSVIGAGAVVSKTVPPYSVVIGNPAKVVKKRFDDDIIDVIISGIDLKKYNCLWEMGKEYLLEETVNEKVVKELSVLIKKENDHYN